MRGTNSSENAVAPALAAAATESAAPVGDKNEIVTGLTAGISGLFKKNKVEHIHGVAKFIDKNSIETIKEDGSKQILKAKNFVLI